MLDSILTRMRGILGRKLIGFYLYGSLAAGDFDPRISDLDLLAATEILVDEKQFAALEKMHLELMKENPEWDDRLEIAYVPLEYLKNFKTRRSLIANLSPGEPFYLLDAGRDWLLNWYFVRRTGIKLFGKEPQTIIAPVSKQEFIDAVREQAAERAAHVDQAKFSRPF
jgi:predicted nucleotidyltransferase